MIVRSSEETGEIELSGSAKELNILSRQVLTDNTIVPLQYENVVPFPYSKNLESIQIKHSPHQSVKISIEDNALLIEGSPDKLRILSGNIEMENPELKNYHLHIEYFDDHFYLSEDSRPLVISFE